MMSPMVTIWFIKNVSMGESQGLQNDSNPNKHSFGIKFPNDERK